MKRKKRRRNKEPITRKLDELGYDYDEDQAEEVEARIRRMFYGRRVEPKRSPAS